MDKIEILNDVFNISSFRDKQEEAIDSLLAGNNTLCLMPTGMGKSLIYQVTPIVQDKMVIILSPLLALMGQQNEVLNKQLENFNRRSKAFNSSSGDVKSQFKYLRDEFNPPNNPQYLFLSPEKMMYDGFLEYKLRKHKDDIGLIVIDEAHCVSQWGHSFRPAYKMIPLFLKNIFGDNTPPILCLTATINNIDRQEILKDFNITNIIESDSLYRHNIELNIEPESANNEKKRNSLEEILNRFEGQKVIVYTHIKRRGYGTREMSNYFRDKGFSCAPFDADLNETDKNQTLNNFTNGNIKIIFATSAFGMGIDIPDIRCVVHYLIPESIEQYYQEVGRAGRDGKKSYAFLLHAEPNIRIKKDLIKAGKIKENRIEEIWQNLLGKKGEADLPHIGQLGVSDIREDNSDLSVFLKLIDSSIISLLVKGIQNVNCFAEKSTTTDLSRYKKATRTGVLKLISNKTENDLCQIHESLFKLYDEGKIDLNLSPTKVLHYYLAKPLSNKEKESITQYFQNIVDYKLDNLNLLLGVLNGSSLINDVLKSHLGVEKMNNL